jgi:uncharacterized protein YtpQ (UPF0354 family)
MAASDNSMGPPNKDQFAQLFIDGLRRAGEKRKLAYDQQERCVLLADDPGRRTYLDNMYAEFSEAAEDSRATVLRRYVRCWFDEAKTMPDEFSAASHDLLPTVRARAYFETAALLMQIQDQAGSNGPVYVPLGEDLAISLVYDLPDSMRSIGQGDLDDWGVSIYEALEVARSNLQRLPYRFMGPKDGPGVYLSDTLDNYDASRMLLLDAIRQFRVRGDYIAMVPNRDTLIVVGSEDQDGLKGMAAVTKGVLQKARAMSGRALRLDGDEWTPWMPERSHPSYADFRMLEIQSIGYNYEEQRDLLDKLNKKTGKDLFVASFKASQDTVSGEISSYCVWSKGCHAWLPRTDRVVFFEDGRDQIVADWDRAMAVVGDLVKPLGMFPERYRVFEYPTEAQLAAVASQKPSP